ncbi:MAG TPA: T9SS type A sorting domain-containing protein, partial [Flavobacteriales bacterium]|nr:T9SS type A sorting domain-containing protein [Flavobacteriales bacterium]
SNGCTSTTTAQVGADTDAPEATLSSTLIGCEGEPALVSYTSASSIILAEWHNADGLVGTGPTISTSTPGAYTLFLTAANGCTNEYSIEVMQNTDCDKDCDPLILSCPSDITVACADDFSPFGLGGEPVFNKKKDDDCPEAVQAWWSDAIISHCPYVIRRTWHAVGSDGSSETCIQYITVIDDVPPVFYDVPDGISVSCDGDLDGIIVPEVTAYDECTKVDVTVYHSSTIIPGNCAGNYTIVHTWTARDQCHNWGTATWSIEVYDNQPPVLNCPVEDITVPCNKLPEPSKKCEATDNCSAEITYDVVDEKSEMDKDGKYLITRTYYAMDDCGNVSTQVQVITVWCDKKPGQSTAKMIASAWPNPFREESQINLEAKESGTAQVVVTDLQGRVVAELFNGHVEAGATLLLPFRPAERNGGAYIYRIRLNGEELMGRMLAQP